MKYESFDAVIASLKQKKRQANLLLGNGFSMAYDPKIFSYNALYDFVAALNDESLTRLFGAIKTKNFELIMTQLDTFLALLDAFESKEGLQQRIIVARENLKQSLLNAVKALHPEHVFKIPEESSAACADFLGKFLSSGGQVYTTNYDLLLYWVLLRQGIPNCVDGFGRELLNPVEVADGEDQHWSELRWGPNRETQNIFYLHGALPLFDTGTEIVKEQYTEDGFLLENIAHRLNAGQYPVFVTAGNGEDKLAQIRHNRYLSDCYDKFSQLDGSLVSFGFGFGAYDDHIIDAINKAANYGSKVPPKLWSIYIGTYSESGDKHIASIEHKFHLKVHTFDAKAANVWAGS